MSHDEVLTATEGAGVGAPATEGEGEAPAALPRLLSARELAAETGLALWRVYELVQADAIPAVWIARRVYFDAAAVRAWLAAGGTGRPAALRGEGRGGPR